MKMLKAPGRGWRIGLMCGAFGVAGVLVFALARPAFSGPVQPDMTIDAAARAAVIGAMVSKLDKDYVFPEMAAKLHQQLQARLSGGEFDRVSSAEQFAQRLTETLHDISHDRHLEVRYMAQAQPEQAPGAPPDAQAQQHEHLEQVRFNYGLAAVRRLQGNLGYIDLHQIGRPDGAGIRIAAAMSQLRQTQALVLDLRHCEGGDPDTVMVLASYLFDHATHLNDIYWRDENRTEVRWTRPVADGLAYGEQRAVYVLTSADTFSGCEDLAYALKNAHRATLVGETTGGGAHAGSPQRLSAHFMMFVPSGRPINPVTHTDWEGTGVLPDVATSASKALDAAQALALRGLIAKEPDADWKRRLQERLDELT